MNSHKSTPGRRDELAFRFVSGNRALDLLATLGNRHRKPVERLRDPSDLDRWLTAAGLRVTKPATFLDLEDARRLRESMNRSARAILAEQTPTNRDRQTLNQWARQPTLAPQLGNELAHRYVADNPLQAALAGIARETIELLAGPERDYIRECAAAPNCSLLYLDRSPAGKRRWCEMETCGSRAKMTNYRRRQHQNA